jgi:hypothetical protein
MEQLPLDFIIEMKRRQVERRQRLNDFRDEETRRREKEELMNLYHDIHLKLKNFRVRLAEGVPRISLYLKTYKDIGIVVHCPSYLHDLCREMIGTVPVPIYMEDDVGSTNVPFRLIKKKSGVLLIPYPRG